MPTPTRHSQHGGARATATVVVILILAVGTGYLYVRARHRTALATVCADAAQATEQLQAQADRMGRQLAEDIGRILAVTLSEDVARVEHAVLDLKLASIVRGNRVTGIIVLGPDGAVLATTDLRYAGRTLDDPASERAMAVDQVTVSPEAPAPGQVEVDAPLRSAGERIGSLRVFVDLGSFAR